ncbi:MAG: hypothetical protein KF730_11710 [Sphingomonas sp.]|uniref:DUF3108 domain-containing protein n=1 Tax=Sphingomonas sp. TaxID=28214 RepID=UPI0025D3BF0A|nr:hypothetical protein [Sphingomonas sp.]MBX3565225.1 hypothetical protein [Sphingomonas sp.]
MKVSRRSVLGAAAMAPVAAMAKAAPAAARAKAAPATLKVGDRLARFDLLKPGAHSYLRSREKDGAHIATDIWRREVRFETVDGVAKMRILQRWDGTGAKPSLVTRDSLFEPGTWRPSTHLRISTVDDKRTVEGFLFEPARITAMPGVADNSRADFTVSFDEPMFNFETDMEMLGTLPLAAGYAVSIPFYHPGAPKPGRYLWTVAGDERLPGPDGRAIDCWIVECDYNSGGKPTRFWYAKRTQQFIKLEGHAPDGAIHRKTLLS